MCRSLPKKFVEKVYSDVDKCFESISLFFDKYPDTEEGEVMRELFVCLCANSLILNVFTRMDESRAHRVLFDLIYNARDQFRFMQENGEFDEQS